MFEFTTIANFKTKNVEGQRTLNDSVLKEEEPDEEACGRNHNFDFITPYVVPSQRDRINQTDEQRAMSGLKDVKGMKESARKMLKKKPMK